MNDSMKPSEIDKDGVWSRNGEEIAILGSLLPIPKEVRIRGEDREQEVIFMTTALVRYENCPRCEKEFDETFPLFVTDKGAKMIPARCCDTFIWMTDKIGEEYDGRKDA